MMALPRPRYRSDNLGAYLGGNMIKAIRMAMKYGNLMDDVVAFIILVQTTGSDGKVTKQERGKLISAASKLIRKIQDARPT